VNFKHWPQFFTATILEWKHLLQNDAYKDIIIDSMKFIADENRATIFCFVIMPNHIHLIWQIDDKYEVSQVQQSFLKYTAQQIKADLQKNNLKLLEEFKVDAADRHYQFWERNPLSIDLFTEPVFKQKFNYIHNNPVQQKWKLADLPENYKYSSASFYETGVDDFGFLTHYAQIGSP
jgi:REP element-mobilizing transposase RayT